MPTIVKVSGTDHKFNGRRPSGLEGAIIHFDAGRAFPRDADQRRGAMACVKYAETQGYAFATVARDGAILVPENMDWEKWGSHAGSSRCPVTGRTGVSQFYVGFEVNSPGVVHPTEDPDKFVAWFDAKRNGAGAVILDSKGRAQIANAKGDIYTAAEVRHCRANGNIHAGYYVPYTPAQMEALFDIMLWLDDRYPNFRRELVFGHDEVAPARKMDPGGALGALPGPAMLMSEFRAELARLKGVAPPAPVTPIVDQGARTLLQMGSTGNEVHELQTMLRALGFTVPTTGTFSWQTKTAVEQFQRKHNLTVDGKAGPRETWPKLDTEYAALIHQGRGR